MFSSGAVHNLYRNNFPKMIAAKIRTGEFNNFQPGSVPAKWATDFEQSVSDCIKFNNVSLDLYEQA